MPVDLQNILPPDQSLKVPLGDIHLTKSERRALCRLKAGKQPDRDTGGQLSSIKLARFDRETGLYAITPNGDRWLDFNGASRSNVRWERGLAIIAILISLFTLFLELQNRGWFGAITSERTTSEQSSPDLPGSQ